MFLSRFVGRRALSAAAKSENSAAAATLAASTLTVPNPLEQFFEVGRSSDDEKPVYEKNMLMTQRQMLHALYLWFPNPERIPKVRKLMCRIKRVLTEIAIEDPHPRRSAGIKRMINVL